MNLFDIKLKIKSKLLFIWMIIFVMVTPTLFAQDEDEGDEESIPVNILFSYQLDEIQKAKLDIDKYVASPKDRLYLVDYAGTEWLKRAVSAKTRKKYYSDFLASQTEEIRKNATDMFDKALQPLAASAANGLKTYLPGDQYFVFRNSKEEDMMKSKLKNISSLKIHKIGLFHENWQIEKNNFNEIIKRYKKGYIWAHDSSDDYVYCHLYWVNILQDYSGGGTYGATYASFVEDTLFGCP